MISFGRREKKKNCASFPIFLFAFFSSVYFHFLAFQQLAHRIYDIKPLQARKRALSGNANINREFIVSQTCTQLTKCYCNKNEWFQRCMTNGRESREGKQRFHAQKFSPKLKLLICNKL